MTRPRPTLALALVSALALAACSSAPSKEPGAPGKVKAEDPSVPKLRRYFQPGNVGEKATALVELLGLPVPKDPAERARALRAALVKPAHPGGSRLSHEWGAPPLPGYVATPAGYDPAGAYPTLLGTIGYCQSPEASLDPFAWPREEWTEKKFDKKPEPRIAFEDGLVLAPDLGEIQEFDEATYVPHRARILELLSRCNREYAVDPDRVVLCGMSLGCTVAYDIAARHPDRFAGVADVSGGCPRHPTPIENLRPMEVYIQHGDADEVVSMTFAQANSEYFTKLEVKHTLETVPGGEHAIPEAEPYGKHVSTWLHQRKRAPWPSDIFVIFAKSEERYRMWWLDLPPSKKNRRVKASAKDNVIDLTVDKDLASIVLHLGEPLVDLDKPIVVRANGVDVWRGKLERRWTDLLRDLEGDGWDTSRAAPARLEVTLGP